MKKVSLADGRVVRLTAGEINAIRAHVRDNGRTGIQYRPGGVRYTTVRNLIQKGILMETGPLRVPTFAPGVFGEE